MAATTFPHFRELPKELQIRIWEHAIENAMLRERAYSPWNIRVPGFGPSYRITINAQITGGHGRLSPVSSTQKGFMIYQDSATS